MFGSPNKKNAIIMVLHNTKDIADCNNYRGISLAAAHAGEVLLKNRRVPCLSNYCEAKGLLPEEQCGSAPHDQ